MRDGGLIALGGRKFRPIAQGTVLRDEWVYSRLQALGTGLGQAPGETLEQYAERLLVRIYTSGRGRELFAGFIVPHDVDDASWTEELARETAAFIGSLQEPEDKAQLRTFALSMVVPFLESALVSSRSSADSSPPPPGAELSDTTFDRAMTSVNGAH